jgi:hypothetical protein
MGAILGLRFVATGVPRATRRSGAQCAAGARCRRAYFAEFSGCRARNFRPARSAPAARGPPVQRRVDTWCEPEQGALIGQVGGLTDAYDFICARVRIASRRAKRRLGDVAPWLTQRVRRRNVPHAVSARRPRRYAESVRAQGRVSRWFRVVIRASVGVVGSSFGSGDLPAGTRKTSSRSSRLGGRIVAGRPRRWTGWWPVGR